MLYGTRGIAWLRGSHKILGQNFDDSITGWVAGAGVEHVFEAGWFASLEYKHMEFDEEYSKASLATLGEHKYALDIDTISIGVGFKN